MAKEATLDISVIKVGAWGERLQQRSQKQRVVSSYTALMKEIADHMERCFAAGHSIDDILEDAREVGIDEDQVNHEQLNRAYKQYRKKNGSAIKPEPATATPPADPAPVVVVEADPTPGGATPPADPARPARPGANGRPSAEKLGKGGLSNIDPLDREAVKKV